MPKMKQPMQKKRERGVRYIYIYINQSFANVVVAIIVAITEEIRFAVADAVDDDDIRKKNV